MKRGKKMIKKVINFFDKNTREDFFIRLFSAWSIMGIINYFKNPVHVEKIESVISTDLFTSVLYFLIAFRVSHDNRFNFNFNFFSFGKRKPFPERKIILMILLTFFLPSSPPFGGENVAKLFK